jgi:mannose-6-phosphate isomerase-like protein (cupin superfamily)
MASSHAVVNLQEKFAKFSDHWSPKIVGALNDLHIKAVKVKGEFVWHSHDDTDELFLVITGSLVIRMRDGEVSVSAGEFFVVPRGVEHMPVAEQECDVLLFEPAGTVNTGDAGGERTVASEPWI